MKEDDDACYSNDSYTCSISERGCLTLILATSAVVSPNSSDNLPSHSDMESAIWPRHFGTCGQLVSTSITSSNSDLLDVTSFASVAVKWNLE